MNISDLGSANFWRILLNGDFNRGFVAALIVVLCIILVLLVIRCIVGWTFRNHRTGQIVIPREDGDTVVSRDVIADVVSAELRNYPALEVNSIALYRKKQKYSLTVCCSYTLADQAGIPAFCNEFKPKLLETLKKTFGIESLKNIKIVVEEDRGGVPASAPVPPPGEPGQC